MGFFGSLMDMAQDGMQKVQEKQNRIDKLKSKYSYLNDKDLYSKGKTSTGEERMAIASLLRDRGYGND